MSERAASIADLQTAMLSLQGLGLLNRGDAALTAWVALLQEKNITSAQLRKGMRAVTDAKAPNKITPGWFLSACTAGENQDRGSKLNPALWRQFKDTKGRVFATHPGIPGSSKPEGTTDAAKPYSPYPQLKQSVEEAKTLVKSWVEKTNPESPEVA